MCAATEHVYWAKGRIGLRAVRTQCSYDNTITRFRILYKVCHLLKCVLVELYKYIMYSHVYLSISCLYNNCTCIHSSILQLILSGESASEQEAPPPVPPSLTLDLQDQEEKAVPSESDVLDILSSAHASHSQVGGGGEGEGGRGICIQCCVITSTIMCTDCTVSAS